MAAPQENKLPPFFVLSDGMQIRVTALDASTGAVVSGVTVSNVSIDVDPETTDEAPLKLEFSPAYSQGDTAA